MDVHAPLARSLAVRDGLVQATSPDPHGLDELIGPDTQLIDGHAVLPAFTDTHNHLLFAARNARAVPVSRAGSVAEFVDLVAERAARTPAGEWVRTATDWHELRLAERRLPTAAELDRASATLPVIAMRGGHNAVFNSVALGVVGFGRDTPDVPGGFIARDAEGQPTGWLQDAALDEALLRVPALAEDEVVAGFAEASAAYAAVGIGTVRDPAISAADWPAYRRAEAEGGLSVRSRPMVLTTKAALARFGGGTPDGFFDYLAAQGIAPGAGSELVRVWGLKLILDGGVEAAALTEPYAGRPDFDGELLWQPDELVELLGAAGRRGWPVGVHAFGDRSVAVALDAFAEVGSDGPALVLEHGGLIGAADRARAAASGVHVTVQQPLLHALSGALSVEWGPARTGALFPFRELVAAGVSISAGSDHPIGPLNPLLAVHGMVSRQTPAGVFGPEHGIDRETALRLYTATAAELLGHGHSGRLVPGAPADLVGYSVDPVSCELDQLPELRPMFTLCGGRPTHFG